MGARFRLYATASAIATAAMMWYAYSTRVQFYPTVIYLVTSKLSVAVLGNMALLLIILFGKLLIKLFLGELSATEVEEVEDNLRFVIPETCLALTIFREQLGVRVVALFALVLFSKFFHWVMAVRVEQMDVALSVRRLDHFRVTALMSLMMVVDTVGASLFIFRVFQEGPSVLILFAFEEIILAISILSTFAKYVLFLVNCQVNGQWANKNVWSMYVDVASELVRLFVYLLYFVIIFTFYSMPFPIIRELWRSFRRLSRRMREFIEYRRVVRAYARFPDATPEELADGVTCIICRDDMQSAKKLPCGHMFHSECLRSWLVEQQTCPTCRASLTTTPAPPEPVVEEPAAEAQDDAARGNDGAPNAGANDAGLRAARGGDGDAQNEDGPRPDTEPAVPGAVPAPNLAAGAPAGVGGGTMGTPAASLASLPHFQQLQQLQHQFVGGSPLTMPQAQPQPGVMPVFGAIGSPATPVQAGSPEAVRLAELQYLQAMQHMQSLAQNPMPAPVMHMPPAGMGVPAALAPTAPTQPPPVSAPSMPAVADSSAAAADEAEQAERLALLSRIADLERTLANLESSVKAAAAPVATPSDSSSTPTPATTEASMLSPPEQLRQRRLARFSSSG